MYRVELVFPDGTRPCLRVAGEEFVLAAARRAGLTLPSLCEQGWCCTCAARVLAGELDHGAARRFFSEDRAAGFALLCTARARSDLRLRTHALQAMRAHRLAAGLPVPRGPTLPPEA